MGYFHGAGPLARYLYAKGTGVIMMKFWMAGALASAMIAAPAMAQDGTYTGADDAPLSLIHI